MTAMSCHWQGRNTAVSRIRWTDLSLSEMSMDILSAESRCRRIPSGYDGELHRKDDLVILGNRAEDQLCAIEMDASCIIVGLGAKVTKTIQKFAEENAV